MPAADRKAAVIGAGVIGAGWAARFALHGWSVSVFDPLPDSPARVATVVDRARTSLSALYEKTKDRIEESRKRKLEAASRELVPGYVKSEEERVGWEETGGEEFVYYRLRGEGEKLLGYGCETKGPGSYNSLNPIKVVTVVGPDLETVKVLGMRVSFSSETPGQLKTSSMI